MSWFTEMAGKAESFLNKMDQVTAAAVSKTTSVDGTNSDESTATMEPSLVTHQPKYTPNASVSKPVTHSRTSSLSSSFSTVSSRDVHGHNLYGVNHDSPSHNNTDFGDFGNPSMTLSSDEKIFEYLNSTTDSSTPTVSSLSKSSRGHPVRKLSDDTSIEVISNASDSGGKITPISLPNEPINERRLSSSSNQCSSPLMESRMSESRVSESRISESRVSESRISESDEPRRVFEEGTRVVSSLREEMQSLTGEISRLNKRTVELETGNKRLTKRMENWKKQLASSDQALRESEEREGKSKSLIAQKDGRIEVLENEIEAMTQDRLEMLSRIDSLQQEMTMLASERESVAEGVLNRSVCYEETIRRLNQELDSERAVKSQIQGDLMARIQSLEEDQNQLVNDLTSAKSEVKSERGLRREERKRLESLQASFSELQREYDTYKDKATTTLAAKDDLIRRLETGPVDEEGISGSSTSHLRHPDTLLQHEVDTLKEELKQFQLKYHSARELERTKSQEVDSLLARLSDADERFSSLTEELTNEKRGREALLQDYIQLQEELKYSKEEWKKLREGLNQRLNDKEMEIDKLRKQLTSKASTQTHAPLTGSPVCDTAPLTSSSQMESRIKSLTDSLMQKQAMVESLNAERNTLTLQLERCESRLRSYQDYNPDSPVSVTIGMVHSSSASSLVNRYRPLMEESVQDGQVARGVKRAYSQLDYFSIRLGQFLRVYPGARIMVLFYILVLHLWVFYLLFTYEPEIHNDL